MKQHLTPPADLELTHPHHRLDRVAPMRLKGEDLACGTNNAMPYKNGWSVERQASTGKWRPVFDGHVMVWTTCADCLAWIDERGEAISDWPLWQEANIWLDERGWTWASQSSQ